MFPPTPHLFYLGAEKTSSNKSPNPQGPWGFLRRVFLRWYPWSHSAGWGLCWWENPPRRHSRPEFGEDFLGWIYPKPPRIKVHVASRFSPFIKHSFSSFEGQRLLFEILAQKFSSLQDKQWTLKNKKPITHLHRVTKKKLLNFTKKSALFFFLHPDFVVPPFGFSWKWTQPFRSSKGRHIWRHASPEDSTCHIETHPDHSRKKYTKKTSGAIRKSMILLSISQQKKNHECLYDLRLPQWTLVLFTIKDQSVWGHHGFPYFFHFWKAEGSH